VEKRLLDVVVISDVHLGTYGCHAKELCHYLKSIKPNKLILNGDIIDIWAYKKNYFPKWHLNVIRQLFKMAANGVEIYYITGNHDDLLRRFSDLNIANICLTDKLLLNLNGRTAWIFHGDVFDISMKHTTKLAKLGGQAYDYLIILNRYVNQLLKKMGKQPYSFSKKIKDSVKKAVKYVNDFEQTAARIAIDKRYDFVICGHIHQPQKREIKTDKGSVIYLNSGDWVENLTSLEFCNNHWDIFQYHTDINEQENSDSENEQDNILHISERMDLASIEL